jgi:signal transduction histidine kinase
VLVLLLAFGAIPLAAAIAIAYSVSRGVVLRQAQAALNELVEQQATHIATELTRERLILRTITGQVGAGVGGGPRPPDDLAERLLRSLPDGGVFDGLRVVGEDGSTLASVALKDAAPHWPVAAPAAPWSGQGVAMHWDGDRAVAYLLAVALGGTQGPWLEGHVRSEDFERLFAIPTHLMGSVESAVVAADGRVIFATHEHAIPHWRQLVGPGGTAGALVGRDADSARPQVFGGVASLMAGSGVEGTSWRFVAALPMETALASLATFRNAAFVAASALVVLILVTAVVATRTVSAPLRALAGAARRFGRGEPAGALPASGPREVGLLVDAFDQMAQDLQRSRAEVTRLHQQEMERAQQLATVGELASGIAHEVRNPLTGVLGALELAERRIPEGDAARPLLEEAHRQLMRIEATTTQLLRYARPPELKVLVVDPASLVERAANIVAPHAAAAGVRVVADSATPEAEVRVDPELMVQVLVNLMLNGIDASPAGGAVAVSTTGDPREVRLMVADRGPGIVPERRADVFRPFFTTKHQGTGLGLPISRQIVERHGGSLELTETPGGGATFLVVLPRADAASRPEKPAEGR